MRAAPITDAERTAILTAARHGTPVVTMAARFHRSEHAIYALMAQAGVKAPAAARWDREPPVVVRRQLEGIDYPSRASGVVSDPEGRIYNDAEGRTWLTHLIGTSGAPSGPRR